MWDLKRLWDLTPKLSISRVQTIVGLTAGLLSIAFSVGALLRPASTKAELVAIVQDGKKAVSDATVEILTSENAVIMSSKPDWSGKARFKLDEGRYRVRVTHPKYREEARDVQLVSQESTELRLQLRAGATLDPRRLFRH